jgi:L-aspartate oxidase
MAAAARVGAEFRDMEFVQFHPTSLNHPSAPHFLLSEAMRGEGAKLINFDGESFMERYHEKGELAPRDVVSRSIATELHRTGERFVYLDLRHLDAEFVKKRFPNIHATCLGFDIDITNEAIPVSPAMHYIMGGVSTDLNGQSSLEGLFAAGECACTGLHGANRLASNSLLEGLVYGARAGAKAASIERIGKIADVQYLSPIRTIPEHDEIRGSLRRLMWDKVGIVRCEESLADARDALAKWEFILDGHYSARRELELKNMLQVAKLITEAAQKRTDSVGAHFRTDSDSSRT